MRASGGLYAAWTDAWLQVAVRTPFVDYRGALSEISPTDLGIKAARGLFECSRISPETVDAVIVGNMAQASYDTYMMPRHIGLYAGVPIEVPALMAQRACGTGLELLVQAADAIELGRARTVLCVGSESMSRNPMTSYTHRRDETGSTDCRDFLWEALRDTACDLDMGGTAECLAKQYDIDRRAVDIYAARSFMRALDAREAGFLDGEMLSLQDEDFECGDLVPRHLRLRGAVSVDCDSHPRHSPVEILETLKPVFGGVQTAGNSAGICDGAAAALVTGGRDSGGGRRPLARLVAAAIVGVAPREMGIGPVAAIHRLLAACGLKVGDIDRVEINEAFGAQVLACAHALGINESRLNVNGGAIAFGHPLAATGLRLAMHCARELARCGGRFGIVSACIGGGQGIALLLECTGAWQAES